MKRCVTIMLAALAACASPVDRQADREERAIPAVLTFEHKYGDGRWPRDFLPIIAGRGRLADMAVVCGRVRDRGRSGRAMMVGDKSRGSTMVSELALGVRPAVFAELWRRAGC